MSIEVDEDVVAFMRSCGMRMHQIAEQLGVTKSTLYRKSLSKQMHGECVASPCTRVSLINSDRCGRHQDAMICAFNGCWNKKLDDYWGICRRHFKDTLLQQLERFNGDLVAAAVEYNIPWSKRTTRKDGYVYLYFYGMEVREHRVVLARKLGRALLPNESPHHLNGVESDNRPENLELWVKPQPPGQRPEDLVNWAYEILATYGDAEDLVAYANEILATYGAAA